MDVDGSQARMAAFLRDHQDKIVGRWSELVVAGVRGRSSVVEARRELDDIYPLVVAVMSGPDEQARMELRAVLAEFPPVPGPERVHPERNGTRIVLAQGGRLRADRGRG